MTPPRRCQLDAGVARAIRAHGVETFPHECCGALIGRDGRVVAAVGLPNTTEEGPRRRFLVDALKAVSEGRAPAVVASTAPGCALDRSGATAPLAATSVARAACSAG